MPRLLFLLAMLLAWPAWPGSWNDCVSGLPLTTDAIGHRAANGIIVEEACYDSTTTGVSGVLGVKGADGVNIQLQPQLDGIGTGCEAEIQFCASPKNPTTNCTPYTNTPGTPFILDGVTDGRKGMIGIFGARWIRVNQTANPSAHNCRFMVSGFGLPTR